MSSSSNGMHPRDRPRTVNVKEAARIMGLSPHTLNKWRSSGEGPAYIRIGAAIRYDLDEVKRFWMSGG